MAAAVAVGVLWPLPASADESKQKLLERVFGDAVRLDRATVAKVKALPPGERLLIDRDADGKHDEAWFVDPAVRHSEHRRPLLVRALDEDGDLDAYLGPDLDSDLYVVDWRGDGTVDVVLDYQDNDHDNDVDEMAFYFWEPPHPYLGKDALLVWWGRDDGDDNLLWYDIDYTYDQSLCQYRCHFSGDESFVAFGLRAGDDRWVSAWENPFLFYDPDGDRCSEVVLRIEGLGHQVRAMRYSFDADDDAFGRRVHDYDFSITAVTEKDHPVLLPEDGVTSTTLRGIPTQPWVTRERAPAFVTQAAWDRALLTWDEMNANTQVNVAADPNERWEGVIARGSEKFPQVGGPPCSPLNKRNELALKPAGPLRLYEDATDHRYHLHGAGEGWLHVDFDFDGRTDATYTYVDDDGDGRFDRRQLDLDADGHVDFDWRMDGKNAPEVALKFEDIAGRYPSRLAKVLEDSQRFIDAARSALGGASTFADPVEAFFLTKLESWMPTAGLGAHMRKTPAGARLYVDLIRDRLLVSLRQRWGTTPAWAEIEAPYARGDYAAAAEAVVQTAGRPAKPLDPRAFRPFTHRIPVRLDNTGHERRVDWPVALRVYSDLRRVAPDFNPDNCAVVAPERWIGWRQIPHQVDQVDQRRWGDSRGSLEISFLADVPADAATTCYIYYSPTGKSTATFPAETDTAEDWVPPNIGWESCRAAYRAYWGQFDFFGKKLDRLIYPTIGAKSYHDETDWGIDALNTGPTSGIGGITLYDGDRAYPVQNPVGKGEVKFRKVTVSRGPVRAVVELTAGNVIRPGSPTSWVRILCLIYARRQETEVRVTVMGTLPDAVAPGFTKLPREVTFADKQAGCFGVWGFQTPVIGDIGMGLIADPRAFGDVIEADQEHRVKLATSLAQTPNLQAHVRYWLVGDWVRGRQQPVAPTADNWREELTALARLLLSDVSITVEPVENLP